MSETSPTLLDYQSLAAEAETVILRHRLTPLSMSLYPERHFATHRGIIYVETDALLAAFAEYKTEMMSPRCMARSVDEGRVRVEAWQNLPEVAP